MYEEQLRELGLTENEVRIYLTLLQHGEMNPGEISQKLGLHRGYVYDALDRMQKKEVVSSVLVNNKRQFRAVSPASLFELFKFKLNNFQKVIPGLTKLSESEREETKVQVHKGKNVYRILLKDIIASLKKGDELCIIGVDEEKLMNEVEPIYLEQYLNYIKKEKITERIIIKKSGNRIRKQNLQYRELQEDYIGKTAQIIYANKVANFILGNPYYLIIIENSEVAETYRKQFDLMWKIAKN